jgi:FkbM family methyltransferase
LTDWKFIFRKQFRERILPNYAEPEVMLEAKRGGQVFVDVGANTGEYTKRLWTRYGTIVAIEPYYPAFEKLRTSFSYRSLFCKLVPVNCAASDRDGKTFLNLNPDMVRCSGSADTIEEIFNYRPSSMPDVNRTWRFDQPGKYVRQIVNQRRLDTILPELAVSRIDLLKIDVEGAEFKVLRGGSKTVENAKKVIVELHDRERRKDLEDIFRSEFDSQQWLDSDHLLGQHN